MRRAHRLALTTIVLVAHLGLAGASSRSRAGVFDRPRYIFGAPASPVVFGQSPLAGAYYAPSGGFTPGQVFLAPGATGLAPAQVLPWPSTAQASFSSSSSSSSSGNAPTTGESYFKSYKWEMKNGQWTLVKSESSEQGQAPSEIGSAPGSTTQRENYRTQLKENKKELERRGTETERLDLARTILADVLGKTSAEGLSKDETLFAERELKRLFGEAVPNEGASEKEADRDKSNSTNPQGPTIQVIQGAPPVYYLYPQPSGPIFVQPYSTAPMIVPMQFLVPVLPAKRHHRFR